MTLLEDIYANPADDTARRVYADSLGDDPRGEFIAVQLELAARDPRDPTRVPLERREADLLRENGARWVEELGFPERVMASATTSPVETLRGPIVTFARGFPEQLKLDARVPAITGNACATVRSLVLTSFTGEMLEAFDEAPFPWVRALHLHACVITPGNPIPFRDQLTTLGFLSTRFELTSIPAVPTVVDLRLEHVDGFVDIARILEQHWPALAALTIQTVRSDADIARLAWIPAVRNLHSLTITAPAFDTESVAAFASSAMPRLQRFTLLSYKYGVDYGPLRSRYGARFSR
ncbi:MAG: TIGR02996 domain-containing protein [Kofleriaceae bacterium]